MVGSRMRYLVHDSGVITTALHEIGQVKVLGITHGVESFDAGIVGKESGPHNVTRGEAVSDDDVRLIESRTLPSELINIRRGVSEFGSIQTE